LQRLSPRGFFMASARLGPQQSHGSRNGDCYQSLDWWDWE
jgi:hypothetical protein